MARRYVGIKGKIWEEVKKWCRHNYKDCYTCPRSDLLANGWKADAGHYQPVALVGSNNVLSWSKRLIRLQCATCNGPGQGMQNVFRRKLVDEYGEEYIAEVDRCVVGKKVNPVKNWPALLEHFKDLSKD